VHACCDGKVRVYVMNQISWVAHRGYLDIRPENSTDAFEYAGLYGANFIETDIRITKDGHAVCFHDNELDRMTDGTGKVRKLTFEQVYEYGKKVEEPKQTSGKQEKYETIVALYAK
jgi:glycerophosphoryl diester phosphodiesterase